MNSADRADNAEWPPCPKCGVDEAAEIVYGLVVDLGIDWAARKQTLGGCVITHESPRWECMACGNLWGVAELAGVERSQRADEPEELS